MRRSAAVGAAAAVPVVATAVHDLVQKRHAVTRNFPVVGHLRFLLEKIGPELRQYIIASNDEEKPFSRDQRRWVCSSAKTHVAQRSVSTCTCPSPNAFTWAECRTASLNR